MTGQDMARALARVAAELGRLFDEVLWSERAAVGTDRDDDANPQRLIGCAIGYDGDRWLASARRVIAGHSSR